MISPSNRRFHSDAQVREAAKYLLNKAYAHRKDIPQFDDSLESVVRYAPEVVPSAFLGFKLIETEEIPNEDPTVESAGLINRPSRQIYVSRRFRLEQRRFTLAHEIGHAVLHDGITLHRDRALSGNERLDSRRPREEREADLFAAEFLMPTSFLTRKFYDRFEGRIFGHEPNDNLAFFVSASIGREIRASEFARLQPIKRAMIIAQMSEFGGSIFEPLDKHFVVSPTAMAIQLVETGLVT